MYATNSSEGTPSSTLERQHHIYQSTAYDSAANQSAVVGSEPGDQPGFVVASNDSQFSPVSLPLDVPDGQDAHHLPLDDNPYSAIPAHLHSGDRSHLMTENAAEKNERVHYVDPTANKNDWSYPLFACFDDDDGIKWCLLSTFCPCYVAGRVAEAVGDNGIACCLVECVCPISFFFGALVRRKIRLQRNIIGSSFQDLVATCCCRSCSLVQEAREQNLPILQTVERV